MEKQNISLVLVTPSSFRSPAGRAGKPRSSMHFIKSVFRSTSLDERRSSGLLHVFEAPSPPNLCIRVGRSQLAILIDED